MKIPIKVKKQVHFGALILPSTNQLGSYEKGTKQFQYCLFLKPQIFNQAVSYEMQFGPRNFDYFVWIDFYIYFSILFITSKHLLQLRYKIKSVLMNKQKSRGQLSLKKAMTFAEDTHTISEFKAEGETIYEQGSNSLAGKDDSMHQLILSEFKVKYDQLQNQYQQKKKEADSLLYRNKKLQVELLNHNVEYYQKQIERLRQQVQKYQTENEDNKHRFFLAENNKKDLEATSKVRQEQLKQTLKLLQKEKITVAELRHQMKEKDKNFSLILQEVQQNNQTISKKYDQTNAKLAKAESDLKIKTIQSDQLRRELERKEKELIAKRDEVQKEKEKYELQDYRWNHKLSDFQEEIRQYKSKENETIKNLQKKVLELQRRCASEELLLNEKNQAAAHIKSIREKEIIIAGLEQKIRELESILNAKNSQIGNLKVKLQGVCPMGLLNESQQRYNQMMTKSKATEKLLEHKVTVLQKELALANIPKQGLDQPKMSNNFQQLLKNQIEQNNKLKSQIASKIQEIFNLKNRVEEEQIKMSLLENQIQILKKRAKAEEKNSKIQFEIQIQNLKNDIQSLRRKLEVTETKLNIKIKQVKDKDTFITNVIIGRSKQQDVPFVVTELKRIFQADYAGKLSEANLRISDLQTKLESR